MQPGKAIRSIDSSVGCKDVHICDRRNIRCLFLVRESFEYPGSDGASSGRCVATAEIAPPDFEGLPACFQIQGKESRIRTDATPSFCRASFA